MKNLLIIGASGFGRDIYNMATECIGYQTEYVIKGFLDDNKNALASFGNYPPIVNSIKDYVVQDGDVFICALGDVHIKRNIVHSILEKGGSFISLIHPTAHVDRTAKIGVGCIILQDAFIGAGSIVGDFVLIQVSSVIGHDVKIGNFSRIDCLAVCTGGAIIEDEVTIHTSAVINQKVTVGKGACVGACSFAIRKVKENTTVIGNPATILK
jgi:sugar O-acyltransferase (sialic acid O-acetyltransferase NeuD family)